VPITGPLQSLIGDKPVSDFVDAVWGGAIAHYPGRLSAGSDAWLTLDALEAALATLNRAHEGWLHLADQGLTALPESFVDAEGLLDMCRLGAALAAGKTLYLTKAERLFSRLGTLCAGLGDDLLGHHVLLRSRVSAHVFLTPPRAQGFMPHRDEHASFILQMEGAKDWTVYAPEIRSDDPLPSEPGGVDRDTLCRYRPVEVSLKSGDVLFLPEWWPHEARSAGTYSLHVTIRMFPLRWGDLLQHACAREKSLAMAVPARMARTRGALAGELARIVRDPTFLVEAAAPISLGARPASGLGRFREVLSLQDLTLDSPLSRAKDVDCSVDLQDHTVFLRYPGGAISGPCEFMPVFEFVARTHRLRPRELPGIAAHYDRLDVARRLITVGVMRKADGGR
jgi:hypothetical protein